MSARDPECIRKGSVDDALARQRRVVARIPKCRRASRAMALRAIGIEIRANTISQRRGGVRNRNELVVVREDGFVQCRIKKTDVIPCAQLIVGDSGAGIGKCAIKLAGLNAQYVAGSGRMTAETIERTGIEPLLRPCAGTGVDNNILGDGVGYDIRVS